MNRPPFPRPTEWPERFRRPDPDRLAELSREIAEGEYRVPAIDIADAIIEFFARVDDAEESNQEPAE